MEMMVVARFALVACSPARTRRWKNDESQGASLGTCRDGEAERSKRGSDECNGGDDGDSGVWWRLRKYKAGMHRRRFIHAMHHPVIVRIANTKLRR